MISQGHSGTKRFPSLKIIAVLCRSLHKRFIRDVVGHLAQTHFQFRETLLNMIMISYTEDYSFDTEINSCYLSLL